MERKLKALIVDDEQHCIETLQFDLQRNCTDHVEVIATASNALEASLAIQNHHPDLIFLDIDLPNMSGLEFLDQLEKLASKVVFTTAHSKYAIPAYRFKAEAFLLKPIDSQELTEVVKNIYQETQLEKQKLASFGSQKLAVSDMHGTTYIKFSEIIACESNDNYCKIHLSNGKLKTVSKTLKFIEEAMENGPFLRIHQSYMVNTNYIARYLKRDGGCLEMTDSTIYPISKTYKEAVVTYLHS